MLPYFLHGILGKAVLRGIDSRDNLPLQPIIATETLPKERQSYGKLHLGAFTASGLLTAVVATAHQFPQKYIVGSTAAEPRLSVLKPGTIITKER